MKRSTSTLLVTILLVAAPYANADVSYSYLQGAWTGTEVSTVLGEQDSMGPEVSASYELLRWLHVFGSYRITQRFRFEGGVNFAGEDPFSKVGVRYYLPNRLDRRTNE